MRPVTGDSGEPAGQSSRPGPGHSAQDVTDALSAEAARLADAFSVWVGDRAGQDPDESDAVDDEPAPKPEAAASTAATPVCGCGRGTGVDLVCKMCPVCRAAEFLHTVRPETLERFADVLAMVAGSLHAIAADRSGTHGADPSPAEPSSPGNRQNADHADTADTARAPRDPAQGIEIPVHDDITDLQEGR